MTDCLTCHAFAPEQEIPTCISCHAKPEGHFAAITTTHATTDCVDVPQPPRGAVGRRRRTARAATPSGPPSTRPRRVSGVRRLPQAARAGDASRSRSAARATRSPLGPSPAGHDSCIGCHKPHEFVATANVCIGCHGAKETLVATSVRRHAICTSCHTHHASRRRGRLLHRLPRAGQGHPRRQDGVHHVP